MRNTIHYHILAELEKEPGGLSTDRLFLLINKNHFVENKEVSEKSIQRALKFLNENISIQKNQDVTNWRQALTKNHYRTYCIKTCLNKKTGKNAFMAAFTPIKFFQYY